MNEVALRQAFEAEEANQRIANTKVGCALVVFLMPAGFLLDYFVYEDQIWPFLGLRLLCSALAGAIWAFICSEFGKRRVRWLGVIVPLLPVVFIARMIWVKEGFASPYYAGLNLVLLAVGAVLHWSLLESIIAVLLVVVIYVAAGVLHGTIPSSDKIVGNFYFIALMDVIVVVGTYFQNRARFREFQLRHELDYNRKQLQEGNEKLMELDQIKSRFFANISHELRTPLTLLLAPLETMLHRPKPSFDGETQGLLSTMHANGMRLLKLINDLLDLVRLESGRIEVKREPLEVSSFVQGLASAARQVAEDKHLKLETNVDPALATVLADGDKLEKILLNLIFNAIKFTPAGGRVEIKAEKQGEEFVLAVADTGVGISEKNLAHVFDRFWQADGSSRRKFQGVGIGLALVKELTEVQGGKASVESREGEGTTFTIRLPFQAAETTSAKRSEPARREDSAASEKVSSVTSEEWLTNLYRRAELFPAMTPVQESLRPVETWANGKQRRLLVADDEPDMLRFIKSQLANEYQVLEAVDGQQAIDKAAQFLPDIILLDMMMPEKDGLQACRELRERTSTQSIPIIMLTARADEKTKLDALSAGASDFLTKPFSTTELHVRIKNLVDSYEYQRKLSKQNQVLAQTIGQLKETETQLVQSEKMASLGRMSAGIIHEINNPLNFATTGLFTLRKKDKFLTEDQRSEYTEVLQDVEEGIKRVRDIVSGLRSFSYADNEHTENVDVAEVLASVLRLSSHEWKDRVEVCQNIPPGQTISGNKNKLIQVLLNLIQNSLDALARKNFENEKPTIWVEGWTDGGLTCLRVRDNGSGIEAANMDKIFDPFFTTKDVGEGMGLGLSICYRIVQEYGGRIEVKSEAGRFCEFTLEFPAKHLEEHATTTTE
jgi:signal transduction histidine kinase